MTDYTTNNPIRFTWHNPQPIMNDCVDEIYEELASELIKHFGKFPIVLAQKDIPTLETIARCLYGYPEKGSLMSVLLSKMTRGDITLYWDGDTQ